MGCLAAYLPVRGCDVACCRAIAAAVACARMVMYTTAVCAVPDADSEEAFEVRIQATCFMYLVWRAAIVTLGGVCVRVLVVTLAWRRRWVFAVGGVVAAVLHGVPSPGRSVFWFPHDFKKASAEYSHHVCGARVCACWVIGGSTAAVCRRCPSATRHCCRLSRSSSPRTL